ncbi:MAG: SRPBCC domain-containing protein [Acidobacteriaceae bacterium]
MPVGEMHLNCRVAFTEVVMEKQTVAVNQKFATDEGNVYDAFLDPKIASKFLFATPTGTMVQAEIDPRVGGRYTFVERRDEVDVEHTGEYLELVRPLKIVFTFAVPMYSSEISTVTMDIHAIGEGCEVTLQNSDVLPEWAERTREGWGKILEKARDVLAPQ